MEKRVRESIIRSTSFPLSLKYSAIEVAVLAALSLSSAGLSEVAQTTIDRFMPSSPRSRSMNSRTSLPRSPIRAMTFMSAFVFLANMPMRVDLPTPEPANIPIRCPFPTVISPSTAFTPKGSIVSIISLFMLTELCQKRTCAARRGSYEAAFSFSMRAGHIHAVTAAHSMPNGRYPPKPMSGISHIWKRCTNGTEYIHFASA